ncbi:hypothetical protein [Psychrobacter sp. AOP7-C1-14]|uniref:hypothetical protein n=1 Tax=Psychrobacter sp. AOP7-C1-14 TaxID=3457640 RepID=UPI003FB77641
MVRLYIYQITDGLFLYEDTGQANYVVDDLGDDKDFTLTSPPDSDHQWYWVDNKWTTRPAN